MTVNKPPGFGSIVKSLVVCWSAICLSLLAISAYSQVASEQTTSGLIQTLSPTEQRWLEQHDTIRIGAMNNWPPINFVNQQGLADGIGADYANLLNEHLQGRLHLVSGPWKSLYRRVKNKSLDAVLDLSPRPEREAFFLFTAPYVTIPHTIIARVDAEHLNGESDLVGKTLALEAGFGNVAYFRKHFPDTRIKEYPGTAAALDAVARGEADAYVGNRSVALYIIHEELITTLKAHGHVEGVSSVLTIGVRKDWPLLASILDKALLSISAKEKQQIMDKWVPSGSDSEVNFQLALKVLGIATLLIILVLGWNLLLKRRVKQRTAELEYLSLYDSLTGLPNRSLTRDRLIHEVAEAHNKNSSVALLLIDLDDFKKINDSWGHKVGDDLLVEVAARLSRTVDVAHTLGHLGGDNFLVIAADLGEVSEVALLSERLLKQLNAPFAVEEDETHITASIGISLFPQDSEASDSLLTCAESALNEAKKSGHNDFAFYSAKMREQAKRHMLLEEHLQYALECDEIEVLYQPKVNLQTKQLVGVEALLRWHSASLGQVSPEEFIAVAERNGLIIPIGHFVLKQALQALEAFSAVAPEINMAVNVSPRQMDNEYFLADLKTLLAGARIKPRQLELEVTEGVLMSSRNTANRTLSALQEMQVSIAMDDFGTGYSSLSNLRNYPFDTIKIDREFIGQLETNAADRSLVMTIIGMSNSLNLALVAEGVETESQRQVLISMGCRIGQGYLFSKAVPSSDILEMLKVQQVVTLAQPPAGEGAG